MALQLLIIDGNGTLLDDWIPALAGANAILRLYGKEEVSLQAFVAEVGTDGRWHDFYERRGIEAAPDTLYPPFSKAYYADADEIRVNSGTHEALQKMRKADVDLHLLTAAREDFISPVLRRLKVYDQFNEHHFHIKDKAVRIREILEQTGYRGDMCAMVGDLPSDVRYAHEAGIHGIALLNQHVSHSNFDELEQKPQLFARSFREVAQYVLAA